MSFVTWHWMEGKNCKALIEKEAGSGRSGEEKISARLGIEPRIVQPIVCKQRAKG